MITWDYMIMDKDSKNLKKYLNENGLRFNLTENRVWGYIEDIFWFSQPWSEVRIFFFPDFPNINFLFCTEFYFLH